jgi:hypothetical protein
MMADQPVGVGLNLWDNPSAFFLPAGTIAWLNDVLAEAPEQTEERPEVFTSPMGLPEKLITALDGRLAMAVGLAKFAYLAGVTYSGGRKSHILAFINAANGAEAALANTIREALVFSGLEAGVLDVTFLAASDPASAQLAKVGLRFDLPQPDTPTPPGAPGMDPTKPPKLR